jgi:hypothetical protein
MRLTSCLLLSLLPAFAFACNGSSSAAPDEDGGASSSSSGGGDSGSEGGGPGGGFYTPKGCAYSFQPQSSLGFTNLALDDTGAINASMAAPERVRVGLGGGVVKGTPGYADPSTSAAFTWETADANHAAKVKYGTSATALSTVQTGYTWTVPASVSLGTAVNWHEAHVCGLTPATTYYYQVGGGPTGSEVWSATQSFTTMPAAGSSITVGVFGDARDVDTVWQLVNTREKELAVNMTLIPGDVVLSGGAEIEYQQWLDKVWKDPNNAGQFLTLGEQMILPINGNHENDTAPSFANWAIPADAQHQYPETYFSMDVGPVHFVMIDDMYISQITGGSVPAEAQAQLKWLDADLSAAVADRKNHPFIVALSHRGIYSTSLHSGDGDVLAVRGALAPMFDKYKVDLVINGHDHEYERSKPLHAGNPATGAPVVGTGTVYVINAGAGANPYGVNSNPQAYSAKQQGFCGGGSLTGCSYMYVGLYSTIAATATTLTMTAYGAKPSSTTYMNDDVIDTLTLTAQ